MVWSYDPARALYDAFGATLASIVNDINMEQREEEMAAVSPLAGRLKDALNKHVRPMPGQVSGLIDRVQAVGERAGQAINNVNDAVAVAEGLLAEVEDAHKAVNEILEVVPSAEPSPAASSASGVPIPPAMMAAAIGGPQIADAGQRHDHPAMLK